MIALRDKIDEHATLTPELECLLHQTIKKTTEDIDNFRFNTTIAQFMILVNALSECETIPTSTFETFIVLLAPFANTVILHSSIFIINWMTIIRRFTIVVIEKQQKKL